MSWLTPHTIGSNPVGICAPTVRDSFVLRGTRISVPALRVTCQSPLSGTGAMTVCSGSNSTNARASASTTPRSVKSLSRNTRNQQRRGVIGVDRAVVDELADAAPFHDGVVVALDELGLVDQIAGLGVVPTRRRVVLPLDQAGGPRQLEHAGRRQLVVDLHLEAGPRRAVRPDFGATDDDHQVGRVDVEVVPRRRRRGRVPARR